MQHNGRADGNETHVSHTRHYRIVESHRRRVRGHADSSGSSALPCMSHIYTSRCSLFFFLSLYRYRGNNYYRSTKSIHYFVCPRYSWFPSRPPLHRLSPPFTSLKTIRSGFVDALKTSLTSFSIVEAKVTTVTTDDAAALKNAITKHVRMDWLARICRVLELVMDVLMRRVSGAYT